MLFSPVRYETEMLYCSFSVHSSIFHNVYNTLSLIIATPLKSLTCPSSPIISLSVFLTNSFPIYSLPLDGLFRFLMSLYLALLERRDVSFYPEQHFSCHLRHFSPIYHIRVSVLSVSCSTPSLHILLLSRDSL